MPLVPAQIHAHTPTRLARLARLARLGRRERVGKGGKHGKGGRSLCDAGLESLEVGFDRADCELASERFWSRRLADLKCEFEASGLGRGNLVVEAEVDVVLAMQEL